ncbi:MAG: class I SAM-dependent methyltransferase [Peptoniphilus sp.]|nr:class I SAM-dependent methyltransferase [Peptoniphilus sp.]
MINISERLKKIASYVDKGKKVADIGTDHGIVPIFLVSENISDRVIASDISKKSLQKTVDMVREYELEDKIETRVGNGLKVLKPGEVDNIIIAGMGGVLIWNLIEEDMEISKKAEKIILQPMQAPEYLREHLCKKGFEIIDESIIYEEERFFEIIVAKYTGEINPREDIFYEIPLICHRRKDETLRDFLINKIEYNKDILDKLTKVEKNERIKRREEMLLKLIEEYERLLWNTK